MGRFVWAALPCSFRAVWPLLFPAPPRMATGYDCCTIAILSQITLRVFISHKQCGHAWFPPFPLSTSDPQANLDVARSSWGCQGGEEKDLSKTLSAVSSKTRAAVRWLLTRLVISTLRCKKPAWVYVRRWKYFEQLVGSPHSAHSLSAQDVFVDLQRKQNGQIKVNLMESKKCICQNRKMLEQNFKVKIKQNRP